MQKLKKDRGDTFNSILPNLLCIIIVAVFVTLFTSWIANVTHRNQLDQICRNYILQMETTGCLTKDMEASLINDLVSAGMKNVKIETDTTFEKDKATYGEDVNLVVSGIMPIFDLRINEDPEGKFMELKDASESGTNSYWDVYISKSSICKAHGDLISDVDKYQIRLNSKGNGDIIYGTKKISILNVVKGEKPTFKFISDPGYYIHNVSIDGKSVAKEIYHGNADNSEGYYTVDDAGHGVTKAHSIYAEFRPKSGIKYKVEHYLMNVDGLSYTLDSTDELTATMGQTVTGKVKKYEGFTSPREKSIALKADGSAVIQYRYVRNKYSFMANDSKYIDKTETSKNGEYFYGATINLNAKIKGNPKDAFILNGWTSSDGKRYNNIDSFKMPAKSITVNPDIKIKSYKIKFNANGGSGNISETRAISYFDKYNLPISGFTRNGYKLAGWSLSSNATTPTYKLGEEVYGLTTSGSVTLYAVWQTKGETQYKVNHYVMNTKGEYILKSSEMKNSYTSEIITYDKVCNKNYIKPNVTQFDHMKKDGMEISMFAPEKDNKTVVDVFYSRKRYTLSVKTSRHAYINGKSSYVEMAYAEQDITLLSTFDKGYKLGNWVVNSPSGLVIKQEPNSATFKMPASNTAISLNHKVIEYTISYILNGGYFPDGYTKPLKYNVETGTFTIINPVREHYTFLGWSGTHYTDGNGALEIASGSIGNINLIANWVIDRFKIKINNTSTAGTVEVNGIVAEFKNGVYSHDFDYGSKVLIKFIPKMNASIQKLNLVTEKDKISSLSVNLIKDDFNDVYNYEISEINQNYTFDLKFGNSPYYIRYHSNISDVNDVTKIQETSFNIETTIQNCEWKNEGYTFKGWSTKKPNTIITKHNLVDFVNYKANSKEKNIASTPKEIIDLYAVWLDETPPTIKYDVTANMDITQKIGITTSDLASGVKGNLITTEDYKNEEVPINFVSKEQTSYSVGHNIKVYIYSMDEALNVSKVGPINFYRLIFADLPTDVNMAYDKKIEFEDGTFKCIIAAGGKEMPLPKAFKHDFEFLGWSENKNAKIGFKSVIPDKDMKLYPIFKPLDATLVDGVKFNESIKKLVNSNSTYMSEDTTITNIAYSETMPSENINKVNVSAHGHEAWAFLDGSTVKIYTKAKNIRFNNNCDYMFYNLKGLTKLDICSSPRTSTLISYTMNWMFSYAGYNNMASLDLSAFNTEYTTEMNGMFANCGYNKLSTINLGSNFITNRVTTMEAMFENFGYNSLSALNLGNNFATPAVKNMKAMFAYTGYNNMSSLNLGDKFGTTGLEDSSYMFAYTGYNNMSSLNLGNIFFGEKLRNSEWMFLNCGREKMNLLNISALSFNASNFDGMFVNCGKESECAIKVKSNVEKQWIINNSENVMPNIIPDKISY